MCTERVRVTSVSTRNSITSKAMVTVPCFTGLRYILLPITWEGDSLGCVVFGPFLPDLGRALDLEFMRRAFPLPVYWHSLSRV